MKILETKRLYLRTFYESDATRMSEYRNKKEVAYYQSWKRYTYHDAVKRIRQCLKIHELNCPKTNYHLAIILKDQELLIGDLFIDVINHKSFVLGYTLDSDYWSKGYASEMIQSFCQYMKDTYHFQKVMCYVYKDNVRSQRVLEKMGFRKFDESYFYRDEGYMKRL